MNFELTGTVHDVFQIQTFNKGFKKREFVIETNEKYSQKVLFQLVQEKCALIDSYGVGDTITVSFNVKGRDWTDNFGTVKYFNTLEAWKIVGKGRASFSDTADGGYVDDDDDFFSDIDSAPKKTTDNSDLFDDLDDFPF